MYLKEKVNSQLNNLNLHKEQLEKEQIIQEVSRKGNNLKSQRRNKWNRDKNTSVKQETASLQRLSHDKTLSRPMKKRTQINKFRNENGEVTMDTKEIQMSIGEFTSNYMLIIWAT